MLTVRTVEHGQINVAPDNIPPGVDMASWLESPYGVQSDLLGNEYQQIDEPSVELLDQRPPLRIRRDAETYVKNWCNASREYITNWLIEWDFDEALAENLVSLRDFTNWRDYWTHDTCETRRRYGIDVSVWGESGVDLDRSDFVYPVKGLIQSVTSALHESFFSNYEYIALSPDSDALPPELADRQDSLKDRITLYLHHQLEKSKFRARVTDGLLALVKLGTVVFKAYPHYVSVTQNTIDGPVTEEKFKFVVQQQCDLRRVLPDWRANHNDCQRWSGIGHAVNRTYEEIIAGFKDGRYNSGKKEFLQKWPEKVETSEDLHYQHESRDPHAENIDQEDVALYEVVEWHGLVPTRSDGSVELVVTMVQERGQELFDDAIIINCEYGPQIHDDEGGKRPFAVAHFYQRPGPFGDGLLRAQRANIYALSKAIARFEDCVDKTAHPTTWTRAGSLAEAEIKENGNKLPPGGNISADPFGQGAPVGTVQYPPWPANEILNLINLFKSIVEQDTSWGQIAQGSASPQAETASEAAIVSNQAQLPLRHRVDLVAQNLIDPICSLTLAIAQQHAADERVVWKQHADGNYEPVPINAEELRACRWQVNAVITKQDALKTIKAQQLERLLTASLELSEAFTQEGQEILITEIFRELAEQLVDRPSRFMRPLNQNQLMQVAQQMAEEQAIMMAEQMVEQILSGGGPNGGGPGGGPPPAEQMMQQAPMVPGGGGNAQGQVPEPRQYVEDGGPQGDVPTDPNALAQMAQEAARQGFQP